MGHSHTCLGHYCIHYKRFSIYLYLKSKPVSNPLKQKFGNLLSPITTVLLNWGMRLFAKGLPAIALAQAKQAGDISKGVPLCASW